MNKPLLIYILILPLAACSPTPTVLPSAPATSPANPNPASPVPQESIPIPTVQPSPIVTSAPEPSANLSLQILSPLDEAVVNTPQVEVIGLAPAGTVVTVNDEILIVGDEGQFKATVSLEQGPNLIEIVASDQDGNETSLLRTVTYEP